MKWIINDFYIEEDWRREHNQLRNNNIPFGDFL